MRKHTSYNMKQNITYRWLLKKFSPKTWQIHPKRYRINDIQIKKTNKDISNFKHYQESKHF